MIFVFPFPGVLKTPGGFYTIKISLFLFIRGRTKYKNKNSSVNIL